MTAAVQAQTHPNQASPTLKAMLIDAENKAKKQAATVEVTPKLSFHGLTRGQHKIVVVLAANDHNPLGPQETLSVTTP
jgi:hypothetical protein